MTGPELDPVLGAVREPDPDWDELCPEELVELELDWLLFLAGRDGQASARCPASPQ